MGRLVRNELANVMLHLIVETIGTSTAPTTPTSTSSTITVSLLRSTIRVRPIASRPIVRSAISRALLWLLLVAGHGVLLFGQMTPSACRKRRADDTRHGTITG